MVLSIPGLGAARVLQLGVGLEDAGVLARLAQLNARAGALGATFADSAQNIQLVQAQLALLGFTAVGVTATFAKSFAEFERTTKLAAFAATGSAKQAEAALGGIQSRAIELASDLRLSVQEMAELSQQVAQLGLSSSEQIRTLSIAGALISEMGETSAPEASEALFRLVNVVSDSQEEFDRLIDGSVGLASGLQIVADKSAAGIDGMIGFIRKLQLVATVADFTAGDIIGLAGALTDLDEGIREKATSSIIRLFTQVIPDAQGTFIEFFQTFSEGIDQTTLSLIETEEGFNQLFRQKPAEFLQVLVKASNNLNRAFQDGTLTMVERRKVQEALGQDNIRDLQTLAALMANMEKLNEFIAIGNEQTETALEQGIEQTELFQRHESLLKTLEGRWRAFTTQVELFAIQGGMMLKGALLPLIDGLTNLFTVLNENEKLLRTVTFGLTFGFGAIVLGSIVRLVKALKPLGALFRFLTGGRLAAAQFGGEQVIAGAIAGDVPRAVRARAIGTIGGALAPIVGTIGGTLRSAGDDVAQSMDDVLETFIKRFPEAVGEGFEVIAREGFRQQAQAVQARAARRRGFLRNPFASIGAALGIGREFTREGAIARKGVAAQEIAERFTAITGLELRPARGGRGFAVAPGTDIGRFAQAAKAGIGGIAAQPDPGKVIALQDALTGRFITGRNLPGDVSGGLALARLAGGEQGAQIANEAFVERGRRIEAFRENLRNIRGGAGRVQARGRNIRRLPLLGALLESRLISPKNIQRAAERGDVGFGTKALAKIGGSAAGRGIFGTLLGLGGIGLAGTAGAEVGDVGGFAAVAAASFGLERTLTRLVPGLGTFSLLVSLLEPVFGKLGETLTELGAKKGGILGAVISSLGLLANVLEFFGATINRVFDEVFDLGRRFFNLIDKATFGAASDLAGGITGLSRRIDVATEQVRGGGSRQQTNNVEVNINTGESTDAALQDILNTISGSGAR